jgi:hypothetical protein
MLCSVCISGAATVAYVVAIASGLVRLGHMVASSGQAVFRFLAAGGGDCTEAEIRRAVFDTLLVPAQLVLASAAVFIFEFAVKHVSGSSPAHRSAAFASNAIHDMRKLVRSGLTLLGVAVPLEEEEGSDAEASEHMQDLWEADDWKVSALTLAGVATSLLAVARYRNVSMLVLSCVLAS